MILFLFHRDLRLEDNSGLITALKNSEKVIPCFILDPRQVTHNKYKSLTSIQFMIESLEDLEIQLKKKKAKLFLFYGHTAEIIEKIILDKKIKAIYSNKDYTPFSQKRDKEIEEICKKHQISFFTFDDVLLKSPQDILKSDGSPYLVFTPFYKKFKIIPPSHPQKNNYTNYYSAPIKFAETKNILKKILPKRNPSPLLKGGRKEYLKKILEIRDIKNYTKDRDYPYLDSTTHLSAHLKFGTGSIRETYYAIQKHVSSPESLLRQLVWRDFYSMIAFYFPHIFGKSFQKKYDGLIWSNNKNLFKLWCEGKTGFPIVDAGMRELNQTGYMHNRVRLITASFLVKDLHIDWRLGEKYFAQKLIDYDPAINNGNWQWVASTGTDPQPYFRIFNPWRQQAKFDPDALYIKKWVPELRDINPKIIHKLYKAFLPNYPAPILDHGIESDKTKKYFGELRRLLA